MAPETKGNTVGSRSKTDLAYIAGFLDGDGSLMLQIKRRRDSRTPRFMATICFYQEARHEAALGWIRDALGIGYLSRRRDGMAELRVNGYAAVGRILTDLIPFIRFKKPQAHALHAACMLLGTKAKAPNWKQELVEYMQAIQSANYKSAGRRSLEELHRVLDLTP